MLQKLLKLHLSLRTVLSNLKLSLIVNFDNAKIYVIITPFFINARLHVTITSRPSRAINSSSNKKFLAYAFSNYAMLTMLKEILYGSQTMMRRTIHIWKRSHKAIKVLAGSITGIFISSKTSDIA